MRIATWNLDHRAGRGRMTPSGSLVRALHELDLDVVVLTEFVPKRCPGLESALRESQLCHIACSELKGSGNNVLIAAREPVSPGSAPLPDFGDQDAQTNVLHVRLPGSDIDILGLRIPAYSRNHENWGKMWDWIEAMGRRLVHGPAVILGDFNVDPEPSRRPNKWQCPDRMRAMAEEWQRVPETGASYWAVSKAGLEENKTHPRQLDHAFVSRSLRVSASCYVTRTSSFVLVDPMNPRSRAIALSDHAALVVEVELAGRP